MSRSLAPRRAGNATTPGQGLIVGFGIALTALYVGALMYLMPRATYDTWGALIVGPLMFVLTIPLLVRQSRREGDPWVFWLLLAALLMKLLGALLRAYVVSDVYGGEGDSLLYHSEGTRIAAGLWDGDFDTGLETLSDTDFIYFFTGLIYAVTGPTFLGGFLVYSWLGFLGLFFFYRAFTIAVPDGRRTSYALLLFFLPSLVFWPSGIGKEAWMVFALGLAAYGGARAMSGALARGVPVAALGLWLCWVVRPHVAGLMAVALVVGFVVGRVPRKEFGRLLKVAAIVVAILVAGFMIQQAKQFLSDAGIESFGGLTGVLTQTGERTSKGGSEFDPVIVETPLDFPAAALTVLFRPLPIEADSTQALIASLEGAFLLILAVVRFRWIVAAFVSIRRRAYVAFAFVFVGMFIVAYSSIANFGILARQRVQVLPIALVLLCIQPKADRTDDTTTAMVGAAGRRA
ncbi:MAG: hypothetical protein L0206_08780 [Actinobacteria bacterium]|nr:hypothetical protein [Actinomycetota bacterium]